MKIEDLKKGDILKFRYKQFTDNWFDELVYAEYIEEIYNKNIRCISFRCKIIWCGKWWNIFKKGDYWNFPPEEIVETACKIKGNWKDDLMVESL